MRLGKRKHYNKGYFTSSIRVIHLSPRKGIVEHAYTHCRFNYVGNITMRHSRIDAIDVERGWIL